MEVERRLDIFEREAPDVRVVRMRPAFTFKRESASGQRRLFAGPFLPTPLLRSALFPLVPYVPRLRFQAVHADDVGDAYRRAVVGDARGAFNLAAEPELDLKLIARELGARTFPLPGGLLRAGVAAAWRLRLVPIDEGWVDAGLQSPLLDASRARDVLGWEPRITALEAITEAAVGMREGAGMDTPPLEPGHQLSELTTGVGARDR